MARHNELGIKGEQLARDYLAERGYEILATNWRFGKKEIDIIARKNNSISIVEVKTRSTDYFGEPEEFVELPKQKLLITAADEFLQNLNEDVEARFDIISIIHNKSLTRIKHIKEAFIPLLD